MGTLGCGAITSTTGSGATFGIKTKSTDNSTNSRMTVSPYYGTTGFFDIVREADDVQLGWFGIVNGANPDLTIMNVQGYSLILGTNNTNRMTISAEGDISIGTNTIGYDGTDAKGLKFDSSGNVTFGADVYNVAWTDYFATATKVGWEATPTGYIYYKKIGKTVYVNFMITGTSNHTVAYFTVPYTNNTSAAANNIGYCLNNGTIDTAAGLIEMAANSDEIWVGRTFGTVAWDASGTKTIKGQIWFEATD